jgi:hypothetical protein
MVENTKRERESDGDVDRDGGKMSGSFYDGIWPVVCYAEKQCQLNDAYGCMSLAMYKWEDKGVHKRLNFISGMLNFVSGGANLGCGSKSGQQLLQRRSL